MDINAVYFVLKFGPTVDRCMQDEAQSVEHPTVLDYLSYIQNRRIAIFKQLAEPKVRLYDCPAIACIFLRCLHEEHRTLAA